MLPPGPSTLRSPRAAAALALGLAMVLASCGGAPTFRPDGPCTADGRAHGTYPALEALLPATLDGASPTTIDSGRDCSAAALGSLRAHDVSDLRFAGATWDLGNGQGVTIAVLALPAGRLDVAWIEEFYEAGARTARRTERITPKRVDLDGRGVVYRLDTLNDLSVQTVVVVPAGDVVRVVLVATPVSVATSEAVHEARVQAAMQALLGAPGATPGPFASGSPTSTASPS